MKNRIRVLPFIIFGAMCIGAFVAPFLFPSAEAARNGYVEKRDDGTAFANQLAPDPTTGMCLQADASNRTVWGPCGSLPSGGTPGQVLGVAALTATRTVVVTGSQTSIGTQTYSYTQSVTGTGTVTQNATGTYTYTATSTSTGVATSGEVSVGTNPRGTCIMGDYAYVANSGAGTVSVVNISNPASPSVVATVTVGTDPRDLACADGWVYSANVGSDNISVIDARTPESAHVESTFSVTAGCAPRALALRGDHLFMVCFTAATFWKIDATDKTALVQSGTALSIGGSPTDITVDDDYYARITYFSGNKVATVEYTWGGSASQVGFEDNTDGVYGIYQKPLEFLAVCASTAGKLYLYTTNLSPQLIGSVTTAAGCRHPVIYGSVVISTHYEANKVQVHSIASSGNPAFVEEIAIADGPLDIKVSGDYAWITRYGGAKLQSIYIGKYKQFSGTNTNTNIVTGTGTQTNTSAATGTQTVAGTGTYTASATGTGTTSGQEVKWVNGTLAVGSNLRLTKGTDTETNTAVNLSDAPKVNLDGFSGTTGVLTKKTAEGWGDSCVSESGTLDSSKTFRVTGYSTPSSGAGLEMDYSGGTGYLYSRDYDGAAATPLQLSASEIRLSVGGIVTMLAPTTVGTEGQYLAKGSGNSSVWTTPPSIPGGDLFMYAGGNQIRFYDSPNPTDTTGEWSVTATTSGAWFTWAGGQMFVNVVNRFAGEGGSPAAVTPATWISSGVVSYSVSLKSSAATTTHLVFGICSSPTSITTWLQSISVSVTSSSWSVFTGSFALSSGYLVPSGSILCFGSYSETASGTATAYIGMNYTNYTRLNGPWIKSGSNAWSF